MLQLTNSFRYSYNCHMNFPFSTKGMTFPGGSPMKKQGLFFHLITFNLFAIILPITMIFSVFSIYLIEHIQQNDRRVNENEYQTIINCYRRPDEYA